MIVLPPDKNTLYLYLDESGEFEDNKLPEDKDGSLIAGILCAFSPKETESMAIQLRENLKNAYLPQLEELKESKPDIDINIDFRHAKILPKEIKSKAKVDMVENIIQLQQDGYPIFVPIVFQQKAKHLILDSTTTYTLYLIDGLVKLIQDINLQQKYDLIITLGGRRDMTKNKSNNNDKNYILLKDIKHQFEKYLTLQKIRTPYLFNNIGQITFKLDDDKKNDFLVLADYISNTYLIQTRLSGLLKNRYDRLLPKHNLYRIHEEPSIELAKRYLADDNIGFALFYLMSISDEAETIEDYKNVLNSLKAVITKMSSQEKSFMLFGFYQYIKRLLAIQRNSDLTIQITDGAINLLTQNKLVDDELYNVFMSNMQLFKMSAKTHLGEVKAHSNLAKKTVSYIKKSGNFDLYLTYIIRQIVHLADIYLYENSLSLGERHVKILEKISEELKTFNETNKSNFYPYQDKYARLCGSLTLTAYFTLNHSLDNLELARNYSDKALNSFDYTFDQQRQWQLRTHIEAEALNFSAACDALKKGIGVDIRYANNITSSQWETLGDFEWYHLCKLLARIFSPDYENNEQEMARQTVKVAEPAFMNYREKNKNSSLRHPKFITWYMIGTCLGEIGEIDRGLRLIDEAYEYTKNQINNNLAGNAVTAANSLIILAYKLLFCAKYKQMTFFNRTVKMLQQDLHTYLNSSIFKQMKEPFLSWPEEISKLNISDSDTIEICRKLSRTILF